MNKKAKNNSEQLYMISSEWMKMWAGFVTSPDATLPPPIYNDMLYMKYYEQKPL